MIKHIFLDMDGTLLNSQGMVCNINATTIKEANIPISLVSARAPMEMVNTLQKIDANGIHVGFNGGLIYTNEESDTYRATMAAFYQYFPHTSFNTFDNIHDYQDTKKAIALLNHHYLTVYYQIMMILQ